MHNSLIVGDSLLTYKKPPAWNLVQQFFDSRIEIKSINKYKWTCEFPECNHVRIYIGESLLISTIMNMPEDTKWVFEYTFPVARFNEFKDWMLNPEYCRIYRLKDEIRKLLNPTKLINTALKDKGSIYDFTQLIDMWIGWGRVLDLGRTMRVCSTGNRYLLETACGGVNLHPCIKLHQTLPCANANSRNFFEALDEKDNEVTRYLRPEPKCERCVVL